MSNNEEAKLRNHQILTEHLGFTPISLVDDIINCVNDYLYECTESLDKYVSRVYGTGEDVEQVIC